MMPLVPALLAYKLLSKLGGGEQAQGMMPEGAAPEAPPQVPPQQAMPQPSPEMPAMPQPQMPGMGAPMSPWDALQMLMHMSQGGTESEMGVPLEDERPKTLAEALAGMFSGGGMAGSGAPGNVFSPAMRMMGQQESGY